MPNQHRIDLTSSGGFDQIGSLGSFLGTGVTVLSEFYGYQRSLIWPHFEKVKEDPLHNRMIVYYIDMRTKDEQKKEALFRATIKLVNEIGFASSSVSKIAKQANVSPSTLYVYFDNKEDLLVWAYIEIKRDMGQTLLSNFDDTLPIRDAVRSVWFSLFRYASEHPEGYRYVEQFSNSPYYSLVNKEEVERFFAPILDLLQRGIEQKIIKNVARQFLAAFLFHPIPFLANPSLCQDQQLNEEGKETAFTMAWDAVKL